MEAADGLPIPQRYWAMLTVALALVMSVLDSSIANVALPTIATDVNASPADSIWVVNAYQLVITICLLPFASLGENYGYRRVYKVGLVVFTVGSLACALSSSLATLTAARVVQGFGAAGIMSVNGALVRYIYPRRLLGRGLGLNALLVAVSSAIGPTVAAAILSVANWPWLFAVNVPIGVLAFAIALRSLPVNPLTGHRFDFVSAALNAVAFGLLITGIDGIGRGGGQGLVLIELAVAGIAGVLLVRRQLSQPSPLLPVDLLRIPVFRLSILTSICSFTAQMLAYVALPFYLQRTLGRSEVATGLLMTPWPLTTGATAQLSGWLSDRYPSGILGAIGLAAMAVGMALLAMLPADPTNLDIVWRMVICGFGFGMFQSPNNRTILSSAPRERAGGASGMLSTARLFGQTIGAASVALLFGFFGSHATVISIATGSAVAVLAASVSLTRRRHQT
jgi:DHA2 family multidrug resistance protein-like MFS transporter